MVIVGGDSDRTFGQFDGWRDAQEIWALFDFCPYFSKFDGKRSKAISLMKS
jgi:hypothetical protein